MSATDRGYINLLTHLNRPSTTPSLSTIQASIAYYLAHLAPYPTPLAATISTSPLFLPFSHTKLRALNDAFRHAVHVKYKALKGDQGGLFTRSLPVRLGQWVNEVLKGVQGGQPLVRMACCGGVMLGLEDFEAKVKLGEGGVRGKVEDEIIVSLAEVMDLYSSQQTAGEWEKEFQPSTEAGEVDVLSMALILSAQSLPHVPSEKLKALPLPAFTSILTDAVDKAFQSGTFLSTLSSSISSRDNYKIHIQPNSACPQTIKTTLASPLMTNIGPLSKLCARSLALILDSKSGQDLVAVSKTLHVLKLLSAQVELDWAQSPLCGVTDENDIAPETREITKSIWMLLKTLLFSIIMITDSCLSAVVFIPPSSTSSYITLDKPILTAPIPTPFSLALTTLHTLYHLAFVISQFGGVTTTAEHGFSELKKVFYLALDVISAEGSGGGSKNSDLYVRELYDSLGRDGRDYYANGHPFQQAKKAYALASIEQLIPVLSDDCVRSHAFPLCLPHLSDSSHRETFESAHSVVLAIFASHAQHMGESRYRDPKINQGKGKTKSESTILFAEQLVPFYVKCLIENSADGKLSTPQLRLAFSALVRSASASANSLTTDLEADDRYTLPWFCIDALITSIHATSTSSSQVDQMRRLHLTLISTLSSLPLTLLPRVLEEIRNIIQQCNMTERRKLVDALFEELLEQVGEREKEWVMNWWQDNHRWLGEGLTSPQSAGPGEQKL